MAGEGVTLPEFEVGGAIAGRYVLLAQLGEGSTARVFRVRDRLGDAERALKLLKEVPGPAENLAFRREFLLMARLHHPALAQVFDFDVLPDGRPYFTMEIVAGRPLSDCSPLPGPQAERAVAALAGILAHLHRENLAHCDLKPDNAILTTDSRIKILDLGMAQAPGEGQAGGTPAYMAPEVVRGGLADLKADLYSLGAVGYHLLTGKPPFATSSAVQALYEALHSAPPPLPSSAPPVLASLVMALLSKDPALRPSASDVQSALDPEGQSTELPLRALEAPLIGRQDELTRAELMLQDRVHSGRLTVVRVAGEAGVGKDRLLSELRARLQVQGRRFVSVRCQPAGVGYHPFEAALKALSPDVACPWNDPAIDSARALQAAIAETFAQVTSQSAAIIHLADWHHADEASVALAEHLAATQPSGEAVFVLTSRDESDADLRVLPLAPEVVPQLACAMLGGTTPDDRLAADLHRLSEGNPLFLQGILTQLLSRGILENVAGKIRATGELDAQALPATLTEALLAQLEQLTDDSRRIADTLAVLGRPTDLALLAASTDLDDAFMPALAELEAAGVVGVRVDERRFSEVGFAHGAMTDAVSSALDAHRALEAHRRIVEALEALHPDATEASPAVEDLARHSLVSDPAGRGVRYGLAAARRSLARFATEQARRLIGSCLENLAEGTPLELEFSALLADADRHSGRFEAACERYRRLLSLLAPGAPARAGLATSLGLSLQSLSRYEDAMAAFEEAVSDSAARGEEAQGLRALTSIPRLAYLMGDSGRASEACARAVTVARGHNDPKALGESLGLMGFLLVMREPERTEEGMRHLEESLALLHLAGDPLALAASLDLRGNALMTLGQPGEALATFEENLAVYRKVGAAPEDAITTVLNVCLARLELGAFQRAANEARKAGDEATQAGAKDLIVYAQAIEAVALSHLGRIPEALALLAQAKEGAAALESPYLGAAVRILGAEAKLSAGAALEALDDLEAGRKLAAEAETQEFDGRRLWLWVEASLVLSDPVRAGSACAELATLAARSGAGVPQLRALLARGRLAETLADTAEADRLFSEALTLADRLGTAMAGGQAALSRARVRELAGRRQLAREDYLAAQRAAATTASPHVMVDALAGLARIATESDEAERFLEVARGHLSPILAPLDRPAQVQYLSIGQRQQVLGGPALGTGRAGAEFGDLLDRPLRELLTAIQTGPARSALPVGDLVARLLEQRPDPDEVLRRTLETARERFGAERCIAVVKTPEGMSVRHASGSRPDDDLERFSRTFIDMATGENRTLWTIDAMTDPRLSATASVAALQMRSIACTPVRVQGRPVGALYLDWSDSGKAMREQDTAELETLAGIAGVCLGYAELLSSLERRTQRLEMLQELAGALAEALEPDELLSMALRHCITISGAERGAVLVGPGLEVAQTRNAKGQSPVPVRISRAIIGRLQAEGRAFAVIDAEAEGASASITAEGLRSVMAVPFHVRGQLRGAFYLTSSVGVRDFSNQDLSLMEAVAGQIAVSLQRVDLIGELARRERMRRELEIARDVQKGLAPQVLPAVAGIELAAAAVPALEVGGDFYDALVLPDGRIGLLVGDVVGKGVPAALMAAALLSAFRALAPTEPSPARLLLRLNDVLLANRRGPGIWSSALYAVLDPASGKLVYATAGHPPPLSAPGSLPCEGLALGITPEGECTDREAVLEPGSVFALYTDGLEDAKGPEGVALNLEMVERRFAELAPWGAQAVVEGLVSLAAGDEPTPDLYDDVTIVALCFRPQRVKPDARESKTR